MCEVEIWFVALRALVSRSHYKKWGTEIRTDGLLSDCSSDQTERDSQYILSISSDDAIHEDKQRYQTTDPPFERLPLKELEKAFSDVALHRAAPLQSPLWSLFWHFATK